jgi:hypothetical protein
MSVTRAGAGRERATDSDGRECGGRCDHHERSKRGATRRGDCSHANVISLVRHLTTCAPARCATPRRAQRGGPGTVLTSSAHDESNL